MSKTGSIYDLPVLMIFYPVQNLISNDLSNSCFIGELSLNGKQSQRYFTMAICAKNNGIKHLYVPADNAKEACCEGLTYMQSKI